MQKIKVRTPIPLPFPPELFFIQSGGDILCSLYSFNTKQYDIYAVVFQMCAMFWQWSNGLWYLSWVKTSQNVYSTDGYVVSRDT